jgi:hypothetical protein
MPFKDAIRKVVENQVKLYEETLDGGNKKAPNAIEGSTSSKAATGTHKPDPATEFENLNIDQTFENLDIDRDDSENRV